MIVLNGSLWMAEDGHGHLVQVTFDQTATPSAGVCMPAGPPTCIGAYQVSSSTESCPNGVFTDGTNLYVPDCIDSKLHEYSQTPPFSQSSSVTVFNGAVQGGLQQTLIDKWFWTAVSSGLAAVESMGSTTTGPATTSTRLAATAIKTSEPTASSSGLTARCSIRPQAIMARQKRSFAASVY